jgi:hypothetical protein
VGDGSDSVPGPTADIKLLEQSGLMARLPDGVGAMGDLAYVGIDKLDDQHIGAAPRRNPRGRPRPTEDGDQNRWPYASTYRASRSWAVTLLGELTRIYLPIVLR